ncbi:MAG: hypothetical protein AAGB19_21445 [Cyanobacteria bacterium P01_F01_bin.3]
MTIPSRRAPPNSIPTTRPKHAPPAKATIAAIISLNSDIATRSAAATRLKAAERFGGPSAAKQRGS